MLVNDDENEEEDEMKENENKLKRMIVKVDNNKKNQVEKVK